MKRSEKPFRKMSGVDALFGDAPEEEQSGTQTLPVSVIHLPATQPRRYFDPQKLAQLADSVRQHGILENLLVRPIGNGQYELVAGERRYRAARDAELTEVPVTIRDLTDWQAFELALVENLQREDLNPVEETEGILHLLGIRLSLPVDEVVSLLHQMANDAKGNANHNVVVSEQGQAVQALFEELNSLSWQSFVSHRLPLLNLPADVLESLRRGQIAYTKAQAIARVKDADRREGLLKEAIAQDLSLAQIKEKVTELKAAKTEATTNAHPLKSRFDTTYRLSKRSKVWDDPKKQKKLEKLLADLENLFAEEQ